MSIQTSFSIKDLENLSGIKAHTIRIWEKRYGLLTPQRSNTNIRTYDPESLRKLLNVSVLLENGHKISKVSALKEEEIYELTRAHKLPGNEQQWINAFKLSMVTFDRPLFDNTYNQLQTNRSFREIFLEVFFPLLEVIGVLWMTKTINPAHEHFISTLIKQKLLVNIERVQSIATSGDRTFVLYLPENEIHELGLMYLHFELLLRGIRSIYLGSSIPIASIEEIQNVFKPIDFIGYYTVQPAAESMDEYLSAFSVILRKSPKDALHIFGSNTRDLESSSLPESVHAYKSIPDFLATL